VAATSLSAPNILAMLLDSGEVSRNFNPKTSLRGRSHERNHSGDIMGNPRSDEIIAAVKDAEDEKL